MTKQPSDIQKGTRCVRGLGNSDLRSGDKLARADKFHIFGMQLLSKKGRDNLAGVVANMEASPVVVVFGRSPFL